MKRIFTSMLLALLGWAALFAQTMNDGHELTALWKQYQEASKADRPQKEAQILQQIKEEAIKRQLPVDFYDAAVAYVNTVSRRDWKQRDSLRRQLAQEVKAFDQPLVTCLWMDDWDRASAQAMWDYAQQRRQRLQEGHNAALYRQPGSYLNGSLAGFIASDWEYVLWHLLPRSTVSKEVQMALQEQVRGQYPNAFVLDYYLELQHNWQVGEWDKEYRSMEALAQKYADQAVAVYPQSQLLALRLRKLVADEADDSAYRALYQDARDLEARRKAYKGQDARLLKGCTYPAQLMETLTGSSLQVQAREGEALVCFQNLSQATLMLKEGKITLKQWKLDNPKRSFYLTDSLTVALPPLPDGEYMLEAVQGDQFDSVSYTQYTLSVATLADSRGSCVYVAHYQSGKPLEQVTLRLLKNGKEAATSSLKLNGFTPLPQALLKAMSPDKYYTLQAVSGQQKSREVQVRSQAPVQQYNNQVRCHFYKDQGAYRPGDTLCFKAVVYEGDPSLQLQVCKGKKVEVRLHDSEDNILEALHLTTNEWGAVSGRFTIPTGLRNGRFELEAVGLGYDWFRVDEFVLPTFDLDFDPVDKLYLVGDKVHVGGRLTSYSGHSLRNVKLTASVNRYGQEILNQEVPVQADNRFGFDFAAQEAGYYNVTVRVLDPSGETLEFSQGWYVGDDLSVKATFPDAVDASIKLRDLEPSSAVWRPSVPSYTLETAALRMTLQAVDRNENPVPLPVNYQILGADGAVLASGIVADAKELCFELPGSGDYRVEAWSSAVKASGEEVKGKLSCRIICLLPQDDRLGASVRRVFLPGAASVAAGGEIAARMGTSEGVAYAWATLYGQDAQVLDVKRLEVADGTLRRISFPYKESYPDAVRLQVFYFVGGESVSYDQLVRRQKDRYSLPLHFTRFQDKAYPGTRYSFTLQTDPGAEVLAAAWDKSLDAVEANDWPMVTLRDFSVPPVYVSSVCGKVGGGYPGRLRYRGNALAKGVAAPQVMYDMAADDAVEESIPFQLVETKPSFGGLEDVKVREDFASALTFQPHLRPAADGQLSFSFSTSDKLSTYYVRVYAHDKSMHNAMVQQEMVVSIPVKLSLLQPAFLYAGDVYEAAVTVSSAVDVPVSGLLKLQYGSGAVQVPVTVPAGETLTQRFTIDVPAVGELPLTASFKSDSFSDAMSVTVPVYAAAQTLTEAHSAVLLAGASREDLLASLQARFVNVPGSEAVLREITVLDMVRDAIPSHVEPSGNDVLSLSEAWYVQEMATALKDASAKERLSSEVTASLLGKIMSCRNADGGFGWFEGMDSSPIVTAVLLERFAKLQARGFEVPDLSSTVAYLDKTQFSSALPYWRGWLSDAQYLHVRALYAAVPFQVKAVSAQDKERMKAFKKWAKEYLVPSKKEGRGLEGQILAKSRRILTLRRLMADDSGLLKAMGLKLGSKSKLGKSLDADMRSLLEYAVPHKDGGWYYPNAVMPWRGLLESEAYAHSLICDLLWLESASVAAGDASSSASLRDPVRANVPEKASPSSKAASVADGIRLWLMLQKETQHWDSEPAFIDAITSVLDGSQAVLDTRVLALSATYEAPFAQIQAAGNGFTVDRQFFREVNLDGRTEMVPIEPGEPVKVGDKIVVKYAIWNGENRSFVRLTAGREAALRPVQQLSGHIGWGFIRPVRDGVLWGFVPQGYRNVKSSATEYYFDSYPEENTVLQEEFFVTQAGSFVAPVTVIESLYAPHYRANSAWRGVLPASAGANTANN